MSKAFWEVFREEFLKLFWPGIIVSSAFVLGVLLGNYGHPYEECKHKYEDPNDIMECVVRIE